MFEVFCYVQVPKSKYATTCTSGGVYDKIEDACKAIKAAGHDEHGHRIKLLKFKERNV